MKRTLALMTIIAAAVLTARGDSTGPATARNEGGTGTFTLQVTADIDADDVPGGFVTDFDVAVRDGAGNPVSGATVTISARSCSSRRARARVITRPAETRSPAGILSSTSCAARTT